MPENLGTQGEKRERDLVRRDGGGVGLSESKQGRVTQTDGGNIKKR